MTLKARRAPDAARPLLQEALAEAAGAVGGTTRALAAAPLPELEAPDPLPVYVVSAEQVIEGGFLENASLLAWNYTVFREETPVAGAELAQEDQEESLHFSHFNEGPFVGATVAAVAQAEALSEEQGEDFEPRLLRVPALYVVALWLHGETTDLLIPMAPTHHMLEANRVYDRKEFEEVLLEAAKESMVHAATVNPDYGEPDSDQEPTALEEDGEF